MDLPTLAFLTLRSHFFDGRGNPRPFQLRPKRNTQDDPLDELLATTVLTELSGVVCDKATGPLITPDMVLYRPDRCEGISARDLEDDLNRIVGIEVKKLERSSQGMVARASGLDYNTTPPCGRMRVYDQAGATIDIRGFYLFICKEDISDSDVAVTAMALVDGNLLNRDFDYYLSIVGQREKRIGLGTYGDGADRLRPMVIFGNPLGIPQLSRGVCLIHPAGNLVDAEADLSRVAEITRTAVDGSTHGFSCYRTAGDTSPGSDLEELKDPFPTPKRRRAQTSARGRFKLSFRI